MAELENTTMSSLQSLNILLEQAESLRDTALAALQRARDAADAAQAQVEGLLNYRGDYQKRWSQQFGQSGAIEIVHCYRSFNERLDHAIEHQQRVAQQAQAQCERARDELQQRELRVASVKKLIERRVDEERRLAERREQKMTDESAQRSAWRRGGTAAMFDMAGTW
jgi:flagellar FliJ protein